MRLMRIGEIGRSAPSRVDVYTYVEVEMSSRTSTSASSGTVGAKELEPIVADRAAAGQTAPFGDERVGAPIARPHQILCIGLNYSDHAAETGQAVPDEPIVFTKSPNTLVGPNDDVRIPGDSRRLTGRSSSAW